MTVLWWASIAIAGPDAQADCSALERHYDRQSRPETPERPELWWLSDRPCPAQTSLAGAPPPEGSAVFCMDRRDRTHGPRTEFQAGRIVQTTVFDEDEEVGPRHEWDPAGRPIRVTRYKDGQPHGERIEWTADGGATLTVFQRGEQTGAMWRYDATGTLTMVSHYLEGLRDGRSCTWRDGKVDTDQLWSGGAPLVSDDSGRELIDAE